MKSIAAVAKELGVAARLGGRVFKRRLAGTLAATPDIAAFRDELSALLQRLPSGLIESYRFVDLPATQPPWLATELQLQPGDRLTTLACGRTYLSRALDVWVAPQFQLWMRIGSGGTIFRGTRDSHSFTADAAGNLQLASYFPGEWSTPTGALGTPVADYAKVGGSMRILLIRWHAGVEPQQGLAALAALGDVQGLIAGERARLQQPVVAPQGWRHLWFLGPSEIYRRCEHALQPAAICCHTQHDVAILQKDVELPLQADTTLQWSWKVDALPSALREDTLPTHDYLSIAVEFDNGRDLTYMWSAALPVGTHFQCPLPTWTARETHWVVRSGTAELGTWLNEKRKVFEDYRIAIGGPMPQRVVRVWLIAVSLFQRGEGRCAYADIRLNQAGVTYKVD